MINIIRELYLSNVTPSEQLKPEDPSYKEDSKKSCDLEALLIQKLQEDETKLYTEMMNYRVASLGGETQQAFVDGFRLGALLFLDVMKGVEKYE